jgi:hypothetical protein
MPCLTGFCTDGMLPSAKPLPAHHVDNGSRMASTPQRTNRTQIPPLAEPHLNHNRTPNHNPFFWRD